MTPHHNSITPDAPTQRWYSQYDQPPSLRHSRLPDHYVSDYNNVKNYSSYTGRQPYNHPDISVRQANDQQPISRSHRLSSNHQPDRHSKLSNHNHSRYTEPASNAVLYAEPANHHPTQYTGSAYHNPDTYTESANHRPSKYIHPANYNAPQYREPTMSEMNTKELAPPSADVTSNSNFVPPAAISTPYRQSALYEPGHHLSQSRITNNQPHHHTVTTHTQCQPTATQTTPQPVQHYVQQPIGQSMGTQPPVIQSDARHTVVQYVPAVSYLPAGNTQPVIPAHHTTLPVHQYVTQAPATTGLSALQGKFYPMMLLLFNMDPIQLVSVNR